MAALEPGALYAREVAQDGNARLTFHHALEGWEVRRRDAIQYDADNLGGVPKTQEPLDLGSRGKRPSLGIHNKKHRRLGQTREVPGGGIAAHGNAIVVAHCPLNDRQVHVFGARGKGLAHQLLPFQKEVEASGCHPQHARVERRVKVVGAALAGL